MEVRKRRRRRSERWSVRLRRSLLEHRFGAAEGVLGLAALVLAVWAIWPRAHEPEIDHRSAWHNSLTTGDNAAEHAQGPGDAIGPTVPPDPAVPSVAETVVVVEDPGVAPTDEPVWINKLPPKRPIPGATVARSDDSRPAAVKGSFTYQEQPPENWADSGAVDPRLPGPHTRAGLTGRERIEAEIALPGDPAGTDGGQSGSESRLASIARSDDGSAAQSPLRAPGDLPAWLRNAVSATVVDDRPLIAVVIDDLGMNRANTKAVNELPGPLTLAFLPYAEGLEQQTKAGQAAGHELIVHMPMEPVGDAYPGPDALVTTIDDSEFQARLEKNLNRFAGYVGINNHMGSRVTADRHFMGIVMQELRKRDILFLDSRTNGSSVAIETARRTGVPSVSRDVFLDHVIEPGAIRDQMALVERVARQTGVAIAIGHPHNETLTALRTWLPSLAKRDFALAPISAVVARRACNDHVLIAAELCGRYLQAQRPADSQAGQIN